MRFYLVHPSIVDLCVNALTLHILEEELGKVGPTGLTQETQKRIDQAASEYVSSVKEAEELFSPLLIKEQINAFNSQSGVA